MDVTNDNKQDDLKASSTSKESEIMSNEITDNKVIEIVSGPEITPDDARSSQNQESIDDGITEDDAVSSPKEFQWKKYVFIAVMLIMVCCFFFKTKNVSKQGKPDYEIKKSTIQHEAPAEIINPTLPKVEEKESITKSEKTTHKNTKAKKIDSENKIKVDSKKVLTKADSEEVKKTKADSEKVTKTKADSEKVKTKSALEEVDIKTEDETLEIKEKKTAKEEKYQEEQKKIEDEKRETEKKAARKKNWKKCGWILFAIGLSLIIIWLILGCGCCGSRFQCQNNIWYGLEYILMMHQINEKKLNLPLTGMPWTENHYFLFVDKLDFKIFVSGLVITILGLAVLFYAYN